MPKNKGAGGKRRRRAKTAPVASKELVLKQEGEEYAQVVSSVGNGYLDVMCFTSAGNVVKRAHIRGSMRKRMWMVKGDIVLVSIRDFQDSTCDILMKYSSDEARILRSKRLIPDNIDINKEDKDDDTYVDMNFGDVDSDDGDDTVHKFKSDGADSDSDDAYANKFKPKKVGEQNRNLDMPDSDSDSEIDLDDL
jgi:translation initiation factor 1A